ncbi:MAG TPA: prolipoprotein diacylglyceryl transferase family protein [Gemmatimonadaceae bacterium]|nr:prolipoprotein diacylglyceryl transferase family protein [Gemmatimonadaceae bacterium]
MRRIFFTWRGITVHSYPAMQYVGLTAGVIAGNFAARSIGLDAFRVYAATLVLLVPALAGARILHVVMKWDYYRAHRDQIWDTRRGGAAQYGGILLAVPASVPLLRFLDVPFGAFWDVAGITIMVGMAFTRIGCFMNGCCAGRECHSWLGVNLPDVTGVWKQRYPTQLYEAAWAVVLLLTGILVWRSLPFDGALFIYIAAGYALGRLVMESLRENGARKFTIHHAISLFIITVSAAVLVVRIPH